MNVGDHSVGTRNILPKPGDDGMGVGNSHVGIDRQFGLGMPS